jgi:hypothetical protein
MTEAFPPELVPMGLRGGVVHLVHLEDREPVRAICIHALVAKLEPVTAGDARLCKRCAEALPVYRDDWLPRRRAAAIEVAVEDAMWLEIVQWVKEIGRRIEDIQTQIADVGVGIAAEEQRRERPPRRRRRRCR